MFLHSKAPGFLCDFRVSCSCDEYQASGHTMLRRIFAPTPGSASKFATRRAKARYPDLCAARTCKASSCTRS